MGIDAQMFARTRQQFTPQQVRRMSVDLAEAFGAERFWMGERWTRYEGGKEVGKGRHALELINVYEQDGPDIEPESGEQLIECYPATRYYGVEYERGDIAFLCGVASWIEQRISDARVWYGGDSSGVLAEPFGPMERAAVWAHFCKVGHRPYRGGLGMFDQPGAAMHCGFCDVRMISTGGSRDRSFYVCTGCDKKAVRFTDGEVVIVERGKDFSGVRRTEQV